MTESDKSGSKRDSTLTPTSPEPKKSRFAAAADRVIARAGGDLRPVQKPKPKKKKKYEPGISMAEVKAQNPHLNTIAPPSIMQDNIEMKKNIIGAACEAVQEPTLSLEGLERASESLTDDSRRILDFLLVDAMNDTTERAEEVTMAIKKACYRAQMRTGDGNETAFYRHIVDPGFMKIVKDTGSALVGAHILPLVATLLNIAIEDRKQWAMTACLKISGLLPTQYDIYQLKYENSHTNIFSGEVNYGDKTDKELKDICAEVYDEQESEATGG